MTLKGHANIGQKLNAAFQISHLKIGQFLLSRRMGSKFEILLLSFVCKVDWLCQKSFTGVSFCDTEGSWNVWATPERSFPNQPTKNWSICFQLPKRLQISNFIGFLLSEGKLSEPKNHHRRFIL